MLQCRHCSLWLSRQSDKQTTLKCHRHVDNLVIKVFNLGQFYHLWIRQNQDQKNGKDERVLLCAVRNNDSPNAGFQLLNNCSKCRADLWVSSYIHYGFMSFFTKLNFLSFNSSFLELSDVKKFLNYTISNRKYFFQLDIMRKRILTVVFRYLLAKWQRDYYLVFTKYSNHKRNIIDLNFWFVSWLMSFKI